MKIRFSPRRASASMLLALAPLTAMAGTWSSDQWLGLNANPQEFYDKSWIYRNLALQGNIWCPFSDLWCTSTHDLVLKGPNDPNPGYPAAGQSANLVIAARLTADNAGKYSVVFDGKAERVINYSDGSLSPPVYNATTNKTTATLTIPSSFNGNPDPKIVLAFDKVSADFGNLKVWQPNAGQSTSKFTDAAITHYSRAKVIRMMDRLRTNAVSDVNWAGSTAADSETLLGYQHSLKGSMDLAARMDAHPWLNVPATASDAYLASFMGVVAAHLKPGKIATVEYSNEPWNYAFPQFFQSANQAFAAAGLATGYSKVNTLRVLAITRDANGDVTVTLNGAHGKAVGQQAYVSVDTSGKIAPVLATLTTGTSGSTLKYRSNVINQPVNGTVRTDWVDSYVLLNPGNDLSKPLASFGKPNLYPGAIEVKMRYELTRLRAIYDAAAAAGLGSRVRVVKGICLAGFEDEIYGLAWAKEKYGSLAWLDTMGGGLSPAYYLRPDNPNGMDTTDKVFQQLEQARVGVGTSLIKLRNILLAMGQSQITGYEGGPHNDLKPTEEVAKAVQIAHREDARMPVLLANTWQDWVNRGGSTLMYFHGGATGSFGGVENGGGYNNNTWALIEGTLTSSGKRVKDDFFTMQQNVSTTPVGVPGVTKGDIVLANVHQMLETRGARAGNGLVLVERETNQTAYTYLVTADTARSYTIALDAGSTAEGARDSVSLYVDGVLVGTQVLPYANVWVEKPGQAISVPVNLAAGSHVVEARLGNARNGVVGLYRLHVN
jgi:hypothetical protein